jgi:hypothetical protein
VSCAGDSRHMRAGPLEKRENPRCLAKRLGINQSAIWRWCDAGVPAGRTTTVLEALDQADLAAGD